MENFVYTRKYHLKKIAPFMNKPVIKVITGMRRVGKSYFIRQLIDKLKNDGTVDEQIIYINTKYLLESMTIMKSISSQKKRRKRSIFK